MIGITTNVKILKKEVITPYHVGVWPHVYKEWVGSYQDFLVGWSAGGGTVEEVETVVFIPGGHRCRLGVGIGVLKDRMVIVTDVCWHVNLLTY